MTTIPFISQLPQPVSTLVMLALLIGAFFIAFKVMEMVMETILVSVLSGGFYLSLVYFFGHSFSLDSLIFYTFAGASLYMGYSFAVSAYGIAAKLVEIPYRVLMFLLKPVVHAAEALVEEVKELEFDNDKFDRGNNGGKDIGNDEPAETKEVVLDKVKED